MYQLIYKYLALMEMRLYPSAANSEVTMKDIKHFRTDRLGNRPGGGVTIFLKHGLAVFTISLPIILSIIIGRPRRQILTCCIYRPPDSLVNSNNAILRQMRSLQDDYLRLLHIEVFNSTLINWLDIAEDVPAILFDAQLLEACKTRLMIQLFENCNRFRRDHHHFWIY